MPEHRFLPVGGGGPFTVELPCARHCPGRCVSTTVLRTVPTCITVHTSPMGKLGTEGWVCPGVTQLVSSGTDSNAEGPS